MLTLMAVVAKQRCACDHAALVSHSSSGQGRQSSFPTALTVCLGVERGIKGLRQYVSPVSQSQDEKCIQGSSMGECSVAR